MNAFFHKILPLSCITAAFCLLILDFGCKDKGVNQPPPLEIPSYAQWELLGLSNKFPNRIYLVAPYIYVAAGVDGIWRVNDMVGGSAWEYLGLADSSRMQIPHTGISSLELSGNRWFATSTSAFKVDSINWIGLWSSTNEGKQWLSTDSGIRTSDWPYSSMKDLVCSPSNCDVMVAGRGSLFGSTDNGSSWQLVYPTARDIIVLFLRFAWHPKSPTTVWFHGEGNFYQPMLGRSTDAGLTWNEYSRFLNMPLDNAIYSMAFDAAGPDTIYIGAQGAVVKSTNAAQDWISGQRMNALFTDPRGGFFYGLVTHPTVSGTFFASADTSMYCSTDGGQTVFLLPSPTRRVIFAMAYDATRDYLYIGSYEGIFRLKNPLSAERVRHK